MIGNYIFARLSASSAVTALLGTNPVRVFPVILPQKKEYPAVVYSVSYQPSDTIKDEPATRDLYLVQFRIWAPAEVPAEAYAKCEAIAAAIRSALDLVTGTAGGVTVDGCYFTGGRDGADDNLEYFYREVDYSIRIVL